MSALVLLTAGICPNSDRPAPTAPTAPSIATVSLSPADTTVAVNASIPYTATVRDTKGAVLSGVSLNWLSIDPTVATVSASGSVRAVAPGTTTITASNGDRLGAAVIRVRVPVATVTVTRPIAQLTLDATAQFVATLRDANGNTLSNRVVSWTSADARIASVSASGVVTALGPGTTTITATSEGKTGSAQISVDYSTLPVASISFAVTTLRVQALQFAPLEVRLLDINGRRIATAVATITSGNTSVALGDADAGGPSRLVWGVAPGTTTLTVTSQNRTATLPVVVSADPPAVTGNTLATGWFHSCAIATTNEAWCWGQNAGQLGTGTFTNAFVPTAVAGGLSFASITAGRLHTCGLTATGSAYCWGDNGVGQLGRATTTSVSNVPLLVPGVPALYRLAAGANYTCGLAVDGTAYCWGDNTSGQLGDNSLIPRSAPTLVSGNLRWVDIAAGIGTSCGITRTGAAYCWGDNSAGQLGDGTTTRRLVPTAVTSAFSGLRYARIFNNGSTTCASELSKVRIFCWGYAALPNDGPTFARLTPTIHNGFAGRGVLVAMGAGTSCTVGVSTQIFCWGATALRDFGAANRSVSGDESSPTLGLSFASLALSPQHGCVLSVFGIVSCWGQGSQGQLGNGSTSSVSGAIRPVTSALVFRHPFGVGWPF